jgi:hypothetical protein
MSEKQSDVRSKGPVVLKKKSKRSAGKPESTTQVPKTTTITNGENEMSEQSTLTNGIKAASEALILPGSSLILDGNVKSGAIHAVGGLLAKVVIGPLGWGLVAADSFSQSVSGMPLHKHFFGSKKPVEQES